MSKENCGIDDYLMARLVNCLRTNKYIIAVNLGETKGVSVAMWKGLAEAIKKSSVSFIYVSDNMVPEDVFQTIHDRAKYNRDKLTSTVDWKLESNRGVIAEITKMWWNPSNSNRVGLLKDT